MERRLQLNNLKYLIQTWLTTLSYFLIETQDHTIPGQGLLLQVLDLIFSPEHSCPPWLGVGSEQSLVLLCDPPPQVLVHDDQELQAVHPPSTVIRILLLNSMKY